MKKQQSSISPEWNKIDELMIERKKTDDESRKNYMCNQLITEFFKTLSIYPCYSVGRNNIICDYKEIIQNHVNLDRNNKNPIPIDERSGLVFKKVNLDSTINPKTILNDCFGYRQNEIQPKIYITDEYIIYIKSYEGISKMCINKLSTTQANKN